MCIVLLHEVFPSLKFQMHKEESNDSLFQSVDSSTSDLDSILLADHGQRTVSISEAEAISRTASNFIPREPSPLLEQKDIDDLDQEMGINFDEVMMDHELTTHLDEPLLSDFRDDIKADGSDSFGSPPPISSTASFAIPFSSPEDRRHTRVSSSTDSPRGGRGRKKLSPFRINRVRFEPKVH